MQIFGCSRYASCLEYLENLKANLLLDIHLYDHVETLYSQIRHKAIIQYTTPFISVDLHTMASAFKTSVAGLEKELEALITDNQIQVWLQTSPFVNSVGYEIEILIYVRPTVDGSCISCIKYMIRWNIMAT